MVNQPVIKPVSRPWYRQKRTYFFIGAFFIVLLHNMAFKVVKPKGFQVESIKLSDDSTYATYEKYENSPTISIKNTTIKALTKPDFFNAKCNSIKKPVHNYLLELFVSKEAHTEILEGDPKVKGQTLLKIEGCDAINRPDSMVFGFLDKDISDHVNAPYLSFKYQTKSFSTLQAQNLLKKTIALMSDPTTDISEDAHDHKSDGKIIDGSKSDIPYVRKTADGTLEYLEKGRLVITFANKSKYIMGVENEVIKTFSTPEINPINNEGDQKTEIEKTKVEEPIVKPAALIDTQLWARKCDRERFDIQCSVSLLLTQWRKPETGTVFGPYRDGHRIDVFNSDDSDGRFLVNFAYGQNKSFLLGGDSKTLSLKGVVTPIAHKLQSQNNYAWFVVNSLDSESEYDYVTHTRLSYSHGLPSKTDKRKLERLDEAVRNIRLTELEELKNRYCHNNVSGRRCKPYYRLKLKVVDVDDCKSGGSDEGCVITGIYFENISRAEANNIYCDRNPQICETPRI